MAYQNTFGARSNPMQGEPASAYAINYPTYNPMQGEPASQAAINAVGPGAAPGGTAGAAVDPGQQLLQQVYGAIGGPPPNSSDPAALAQWFQQALQAAQNPASGTPPQVAQALQLFALVGSQAAPGVQQDLSQYQQLQNQVTNIGQLTGSEEYLARQQAGFSQQLLGLQGRELGLQRTALGTPQQYQQFLGGGLPTVNAQGQITGNVPNTQQGILGLEQHVARQQYQTGQEQLESAAGARGATTAQGTKQAYQQAALGQAEREAQFGYQEGQLTQQQQFLDIASQRLGISGQQIQASLQQAIDQAGLNQVMSTGDLLNQMSQVAGGITGGIEQAVAQLAPLILAQRK